MRFFLLFSVFGMVSRKKMNKHADKLEAVGMFVGAWDFSPETPVLFIGLRGLFRV